MFPSARAAEFPVYSSTIDLLYSVVAQTGYQANWKVGPVQVLRNEIAVRLQSYGTREADFRDQGLLHGKIQSGK